MAHNIFGDRFYGHREAAWHKLGYVSQEEMSGIEALTAIGGGFWFDKRPIMVEFNGGLRETGGFALVRSMTSDDPEEKIFGYVTDKYNPFQPLEAVELFDVKVARPVETLGFLGDGQRMFLTWELQDFDVTPGDTIRVFGFLALGFDAVMGASLNVVTKRTVCENTWIAALNEAKNSTQSDRGTIWSGKHTQKNMARDLGIWMSHVQENAERQAGMVKELFGFLSQVPVSKDDAYNLLFKIYPAPAPLPVNYPEELRREREDTIEKGIQASERSVDSVMSLFEGEGTAIDATAWGLFNAVVEQENWGRATRKAPEKSILFGARASAMNRASKVLSEYAGYGN